MEAAATALTTLPLSTKILMTELAIFVKVEKMEVRIFSSLHLGQCQEWASGICIQWPSESDGAL